MGAPTKPNLKRLKTALHAKQADLLRGLKNREGIVIEQAAEDIDHVQRAAEREITVSRLNLDSDILRSIRAALLRLEEGMYGTCLHCEKAIGQKRLAAVPWAEYCIACQGAADQGKFNEQPAAVSKE